MYTNKQSKQFLETETNVAIQDKTNANMALRAPNPQQTFHMALHVTVYTAFTNIEQEEDL